MSWGSGRFWAYVGVILGGTVSLAANYATRTCLQRVHRMTGHRPSVPSSQRSAGRRCSSSRSRSSSAPLGRDSSAGSSRATSDCYRSPGWPLRVIPTSVRAAHLLRRGLADLHHQPARHRRTDGHGHRGTTRGSPPRQRLEVDYTKQDGNRSRMTVREPPAGDQSDVPPPTDELITLAREVARELSAQGLKANRRQLTSRLRAHGRSVSNARAGALLRSLSKEA
jgi:hypothetical protein